MLYVCVFASIYPASSTSYGNWHAKYEGGRVVIGRPI